MFFYRIVAFSILDHVKKLFVGIRKLICTMVSKMCFKISIIVPIYNQEKYLNKSLESIINQTFGFENIELILVDDCSTDNSKHIIKDYSSKYNNIIPIFLEKNNGNAGVPKNRGLDVASSDYVMFFDPDDYLMEDICETLYDKIVLENADIVSGNAIVCKNGKFYEDITFSDNRSLIYPNNNYDDFKKFRCCGTIFDRSFLESNNVRFLNSSTEEDTFFANKSFFDAKKVCFLDEYYGFIYCIRNNNSITQTHTKEIVLGEIYSYGCIKQYLDDKNVIVNNDPFLIIIYTSFGAYWDCSKNDEIFIFEKIFNYKYTFKSSSDYLPFHYKVADFLLDKKLFSLLYYYHKFFAWLSHTKFIQKKFNPRIEIDINKIDYDKIKWIKDW